MCHDVACDDRYQRWPGFPRSIQQFYEVCLFSPSAECLEVDLAQPEAVILH